MRFAYKIPDTDRSAIFSKDSQPDENEDVQGLPELLEQIHKEWAKQGGPQSEEETALFGALPKLMKAIQDPSIDGHNDPDIAHMIVVLKGQSLNPQAVMASIEKEAFLPALAAGLGLAEGAGIGAMAGAAAQKALPFAAKGMGIHALMGMGGGGEGGGGEAIATDPTDVYASFRGSLEDDAGTLHYAIRVDRELEALRAQVIAALNAWSNNFWKTDDQAGDQPSPEDLAPLMATGAVKLAIGEDGSLAPPIDPMPGLPEEEAPNKTESLNPDQLKAVWWSLLNAAKNAESIAELVLILQAIPDKYHDAVNMMPQMTPGDDSGGGAEGLPSNTPAPGENGGTPGSQPQTGDVQTNLIPGALSSVISNLGIEWKEATNVGTTGMPDPFSSPVSGNPDQSGTWINNKAIELQGLGMDPATAHAQAAMMYGQQNAAQQGSTPAGPAMQTQVAQTPSVSPIADTTGELYSGQDHNLPAGHTAAISNIEKEMPMGLESVEAIPVDEVENWKDAEGVPLKEGKTYKMTTDQYDVPDVVRVVASTPEGLILHIENGKGGYEIKVGEQEKRKSNFRFEKIAHALSTEQQKDLVLEEGIARNLDKLNLAHSHYESEYPNFHSSVREFLDPNIPLSNLSLLEDDSLLFI